MGRAYSGSFFSKSLADFFNELASTTINFICWTSDVSPAYTMSSPASTFICFMIFSSSVLVFLKRFNSSIQSFLSLPLLFLMPVPFPYLCDHDILYVQTGRYGKVLPLFENPSFHHHGELFHRRPFLEMLDLPLPDW